MDELAKLKAELEETGDTTNTVHRALWTKMTKKFGEYEETLQSILGTTRRDLTESTKDFHLSLRQTDENIRRLTETNEILSSCMLEHQTHLKHLMSFKEQRHAQMDNRWQKLENLESKVTTVQTDTALQSQ